MKTRTSLLSAAVAVCLSVAALGAETGPQQTGEGTFERSWPAVSVAHTRVTLSSKLDERVAKIEVEEGQKVNKGDVLLRFDARQVEARIAVAEVEADFKGRIESARTRYEYLKREFERSKNLSTEEMITESELDNDRTQMELASLEMAELRRGEKLGEARLHLYRTDAEDYVVRSPVNGVVSDLWVDEGEMAEVGESLVEVIDPDVIEIRVHLREEHAMNVAAGGEVAVKFVTVSQRPVPGTIYFVSPYVESSSGTFTVKILAQPNVEQIKPGMACEIRFLPAEKP